MAGWARFMDGSMWLFRQGEDFCDLEVFRNQARSAATCRGLRLRTRKTEDKGKPALAIQARGER